MTIIDTLVSSVLPVALIFAVGYFVSWRGGFSQPDAASIFKFIAQIAAPAITINIIITTDVASLDPMLAGLYLISELLVYAAGFFVTRFWFRLNFKDALLSGFAASFANFILSQAVSALIILKEISLSLSLSLINSLNANSDESAIEGVKLSTTPVKPNKIPTLISKFFNLDISLISFSSHELVT